MKKALLILAIGIFAITACEPVGVTKAINTDSSPEETMEVTDDSPDDMDDDTNRTVNIEIQGGTFSSQKYTIHEDTMLSWTNNDDVSYTIVLVKMDDSSDDRYEITVAPGETVSLDIDDDGMFEFYIDGNMTASGTITISDDYNDDEYDDSYDDDDYGDDMDSDDDMDDDDYDDDMYDDDDDYDDDMYDDEDEEDEDMYNDEDDEDF